MRRPDRSARKRNDPFNEGATAARARRLRSLGIALALVAFIAIVFVVSIIKLSGGLHAAH